IIGAGRVGRALALASRRSGLDVVAGWSRTEPNRRRFADEFDVPVATRSADAIDGCDIVFVAVPDEQLAPALADLASRLDGSRAPFVVITSGSASIGVGAPVVTAGGRLVRIHPLRAIT